MRGSGRRAPSWERRVLERTWLACWNYFKNTRLWLENYSLIGHCCRCVGFCGFLGFVLFYFTKLLFIEFPKLQIKRNSALLFRIDINCSVEFFFLEFRFKWTHLSLSFIAPVEHHQKRKADSEWEKLWHNRDPGAHPGVEEPVEEVGGPGSAAPGASPGGAQFFSVFHRDGRPGCLAAGCLPPGLKWRLWTWWVLHTVPVEEAQRGERSYRQTSPTCCDITQTHGGIGSPVPWPRGG